MNQMTINDVAINGKRLDCFYTIRGEWEKVFKLKKCFFIEYSNSIDRVPENVAVVPFICNILPVAWIFDAEIVLDEIDKDFYESIDDFKQGFIQMYPRLDFRGKVVAKKLIENRQGGANNSAAFFSAGVDSFQTLISHIDERPTLVTLWGSDIKFEDEMGWNLVKKHVIQIASESELNYVCIKSSFRRFLDERALNNYVIERAWDSWWHGFQHGIGLLGHMAPYAYQYQIKTVYIASSFTAYDKKKVPCASDPTIDNFVKFCGCHVVHDGYEYTRQDKIHHICEYVKRTGKDIQLRVCWESKGGLNCCHCEKCYRTILGIIAEKENPLEYGFNYTDKEFTIMMLNMRTKEQEKFYLRYKYIQEALRKNYTIAQVDRRLKWFYKLNIDMTYYTPSEPFFRVIAKTRSNARRLLGMIKNWFVYSNSRF